MTGRGANKHMHIRANGGAPVPDGVNMQMHIRARP